MKEHGWIIKCDNGRFYSEDEDDFFDSPSDGCFYFFEEDAEEVLQNLLDAGETVKRVPATWDGDQVEVTE